MYIKAYRNKIKDQDWQETNPQVSEFILKDASWTANLTDAERRLLDFFLWAHNKFHGNLYFSQQTLAKYINITRPYVCTILKKFESWGLIASRYRHMKTCQYKVSDYFKDLFIRKKLQKALPSLKWLPLVLLTQIYLGEILLEKTNNKQQLLNIYLTRVAREEKTSQTEKLRGRGRMSLWGAEERQKFLGDCGIRESDRSRFDSVSDESILYAVGQLKRQERVVHVIPWLLKVASEFDKRAAERAAVVVPTILSFDEERTGSKTKPMTSFEKMQYERSKESQTTNKQNNSDDKTLLKSNIDRLETWLINNSETASNENVDRVKKTLQYYHDQLNLRLLGVKKVDDRIQISDSQVKTNDQQDEQWHAAIKKMLEIHGPSILKTVPAKYKTFADTLLHSSSFEGSVSGSVQPHTDTKELFNPPAPLKITEITEHFIDKYPMGENQQLIGTLCIRSLSLLEKSS